MSPSRRPRGPGSGPESPAAPDLDAPLRDGSAKGAASRGRGALKEKPVGAWSRAPTGGRKTPAQRPVEHDAPTPRARCGSDRCFQSWYRCFGPPGPSPDGVSAVVLKPGTPAADITHTGQIQPAGTARSSRRLHPHAFIPRGLTHERRRGTAGTARTRRVRNRAPTRDGTPDGLAAGGRGAPPARRMPPGNAPTPRFSAPAPEKAARRARIATRRLPRLP